MDSLTQEIISKYTHAQIRDILERARNSYHNGRITELTDPQYDYLSTYVNDDMKIGAYPTGNDAVKVKLPVHMGSMDKLKQDSSELISFLREYTHVKCVSEKLDGISLLVDASKHPFRAYTRGDGEIGQDVSHILPYIKGLPSFKTLKVSGYIRGEAIIRRSQWEQISEKGKNARNFVAGVINTKNPNKDDLKCIEFVAYEYIPAPVQNELMTTSVQFKYLKANGFNVVKHILVPHNKVSSSTMIALLDEWKQKSLYEIDGIIIANDMPYPLTIRGNPKHAKAFKHNVIENALETTVVKVEWNVSKDGKWKPVVIVEPIEMEGVEIRRASGYNARFVEENAIGKGAVVRILRSGGVIPKIVEIVKKSKTVVLPENSTWDETHTELMTSSSSSLTSVSQVVEDNENINNQVRLSTQQQIDAKRIEHFITQCGIEFYKEKAIQRGMLADVITNYHGLLEASVADFQRIDGIKEKMAEKIYESVQSKIKEVQLYQFAAGLSIFPNIGAKKLKDLFEFENGRVFREYQESLTQNIHSRYIHNELFASSVAAVDGFSNKSVNSIVDNMDIFFIELQYIIDKYPNSVIAKTLKRYIENKPATPRNSIATTESAESIAKVAGKTIVFTGVRDKELEARLEAMGARIGTRVRPESILVAKDVQKQTTKAREAQEMNCPIYTPEEFKQFVFGQ
jgi:NAD-dependent DNA ligase